MGEVKDFKLGTDADVERNIQMQVDAKRRADNCAIDIKNALVKWDCFIDPMIQISGQDIRTTYRVVPKVKV